LTVNPDLINGGVHVDSRGTVSFVNDFDFKGVDRFYWIKAWETNSVRAWVGHRREQKWFTVVQGEVLLATVRPDDWARPCQNLPVTRYVLSATQPHVLHVPAGYATASVNLRQHSILMVFSSGRIEDARTDDFRFAENQWPIR
jgi:dTDP-4-dehydrorhamnose 3,5-epimerase